MWLDHLRIAKGLGNLDAVLPPGITSLRDCPYTVFEAVRIGMFFLDFDELPSDERPPKRIWLDSKKLEEWFDVVKRRREEKYGSGGDDGWDKTIDDPVENPAAAGLIVG